MSPPSPSDRTSLGLNVPSACAVSFTALYTLGVLVTSLLRDHGRVSLTDVAATPDAIGAGKPWLLLTSGLVVEGDLALSVLGLLVLSLAVLLVCGWRVLWGAGILGHVGSALVTYAALALITPVEQERRAHLLHAQDYGVSAFVAGGLGALAVGGWRRRREWPLTRLWPALAIVCAGSVVVMTLHVLDPFWFEHIPAFAIGAGVAFAGRFQRTMELSDRPKAAP